MAKMGYAPWDSFTRLEIWPSAVFRNKADVGKIHTSKDNDEMLQQDLDGEEDAMDLKQALGKSSNKPLIICGE